jgi:tetratricopeptide (TPR) repeat protein
VEKSWFSDTLASSLQPLMSRARRIRRQQKESAEPAAPFPPRETPVPRAGWLLGAAFLLPNLGALGCRFVLDDLPLIVENEKLHSLGNIVAILRSGYWPDRAGISAYRPLSQIAWAALWSAGGGRPFLFHLFGLLLGLAAVLLAYRFLVQLQAPPRTAFTAALLFALFPIHTEATTSVVGSAELLAAAFGFGAVLVYAGGRRIAALALFALAVFSKESAAAFAALPLALPALRPAGVVPAAEQGGHAGSPLRRDLATAAAAAAIIGAALLAHRAISRTGFVPPIDNPMALLDPARRVLSALWVQCLYIFKTVLPIWLSADYSYKQIPLVMSLDDGRAWAGLGLVAAAGLAAWRYRQLRPAVLVYAILFSATANVLFPIGTMMGERLAYAPGIGLALLLAMPLARMRQWKAVLIAVAVLYGGRTVVRNLDWRNPEVFYTRLLDTSPASAKSHYFYGILLSSRGDDNGAVATYDRAIAIFPAYSEAYHNRGNALARLGRREEAAESYAACLRFDPGHVGAAANLATLRAGLPLSPPRKRL